MLGENDLGLTAGLTLRSTASASVVPTGRLWHRACLVGRPALPAR
jgi:hypothetical protein